MSILTQKSGPVLLFEIGESLSDAYGSDCPLHAGLYEYKSIENSVRRRSDPCIKTAKCILVKITDSKTKPLLFGYVYRSPASFQEWPDKFINMMDKAIRKNAIFYFHAIPTLILSNLLLGII